jgi:O-methyltransferase
MKKAAAFVKSFILFLRPGFWAGFLTNPFLWLSCVLRLSRWIGRNPVQGLNDFYTPFRDYSKRYQLYQHLLDALTLSDQPVQYVELGVSRGLSFQWWVKHNTHADSRFYGFDTFEGLPENWGLFEKGSMAANIPVVDGNRHEFFKGLFQETLPGFLLSGKIQQEKFKIIHLDADLFSSTLYALTSLHSYLKPGDILIFDEFNVPTHEFRAFMDYADSYYIKYEVLAAVNNYFQVAIMIK